MCWALWGMMLVAAVQAGSPPSGIEQLPAKPGVYIWRAAAGWERVYPAILDEKKSKGMERFLQTEGQIPLNITLTFDGSNSPVQIPERRPAFFVRGIAGGDDTLIVQLESRQDSRQARTSSVLVGTSNREGFRPADIRRVRISQIDKDCITVTPQEDLRTGEYLLIFGRVDNAFDFGIQLR